MDIKQFNFLTTNATKAKDFGSRGFQVKEFDREIKEVLSPSVQEVVLYKSKETNMPNVIVEDTSLKIEKAHFFGTQIKDYWSQVEFDENFHNRKAVWEVSVCLSTENKYYIATGKTDGILQYPPMENAYHFNKVFSVQYNEEIKHFGALSSQIREQFSPRIKAIDNLKKALLSEDFSNILVYDKKDIPEWSGLYQAPPEVKRKLTI